MQAVRFKKLIPALALGLSLVLASGAAQAALTRKATITENLKTGQGSTQIMVDRPGANNEVPLHMVAPASGGTGFTWGGYSPSTVNDAHKILENHDAGYGTFICRAFDPGQYFYTIFSSAGTKTSDQFIDLSGSQAQIKYNVYTSQTGGLASPVFKIRFLIRTNSGTKWYISSLVDVVSPVPASTTACSTALSGLSWYAVDSAVNTNLNALAGSDEAALSYASTASTPDLSMIDGAGWVLAEGKTSTALESSFKLTRLTWTANAPSLKATANPGYPMLTSALVLGPNPSTGQLALTNANPGAISITGLRVDSPDGQIALVSPPALPASAAADSTLTLNLKYLATSVDTSSATLYVTCNQDNVAGTVVPVTIVGRPLKTASVEENFKGSGTAPNPLDLHIASARNTSPNQYPVVMNPPVWGAGNTGFKWGAFSNATSNTGGRDWVALAGGGLAFAGAGTDDANTAGNYHGSYAWTIFDSLGGTTPDYSLKLEKYAYYCNKAATGQQIRFLLRDAAGQWFISDKVLDSPVSTGYVTCDLDGWIWRRVNSTAEAYMNANSSIPQVAIGEPSSLPTGTLNLNGITGGGVYVEVGDTSSANPALAFPGLKWIVRPSDNDRMVIQSKNTFTSNTAIVANKRVGVMALNCKVTTGAEVALDGVDVTVDNATGLRSMFIYDDPNANGLPDDGGALTSCTMNGNTAKVRFIAPEVVQRGTPKTYTLAAVFNDNASSRSYTFTIPASAWKISTTGGNGDMIVQVPATPAATFKVNALAFPDVAALHPVEEFKETWNGVAEGIIPTTAASGTVTGSVNTWKYYFGNTTKTNALFSKINNSVMAGVETKGMTTEPTPYENFSYQNRNTFSTIIDQDLVRVVRVDFTMQITSTTLSTLAPHFSPRPVGDSSNVAVRLIASSGNYQFTFMPLTDWNAYAFTLNTANNPAEYAPGNILAYSSGDGTGAYQVSLYFAPTGKNTVAKVEMKHVASGKTLSWVTLLNGAVTTVTGFDLQFNNFANAFIDDLTLTSYSFRVNPVRSWSMFE